MSDIQGDKVPTYRILPEVIEGMKKVKFLKKKMELIKTLPIPQVTKADLFRKIRFDAQEAMQSLPNEPIRSPFGMDFKPEGDLKLRY